jgi:hypothetical protein
MAVGDEDVAIGRDQDVGRLAEGVRPAAGYPRLAERHQELAVLVELHDGVALAVVHGAAVADPDVVVLVDMEPVRIVDHAAAEALDHLAGGVELHDRVEVRLRAIGRRLAAVEGPHALAVAIDVDADHRAELAPIRQLGPAVVELVEVRRVVGPVGLLRRGTHRRQRNGCDDGGAKYEA